MDTISESYLDMALAFEAAEKYKQALVWYRKIENNPDVYETIGEYYYLGRGCGQDKAMAEKYFQKAAAYANVDALCNLALCKRKTETALACYRRAADKGSAYAMNMVGILLEDLDPANIGSAETIRWFKKAADAGSEYGCYNYAMNTEDINEKMQYLEKAADMDCFVAMEKYAEYLSSGLFGETDPEKALEIRKRIEAMQK